MKLMFDIGANAGDIALHFSRFTDRVVAFECNPNLVKKLTKFFVGTNVLVDNRGLSNEVSSKIFNICDATTLSSFSDTWISTSRFSDQHYWDIPVTVQTTTLDKVIEEYGIPDYVKIDVEGYEYEVLQGLTKLLPDTIFCFEWHEEHWDIVLKCIEYIKTIGYTKFTYKEMDHPWEDRDIDWSTWDDINIGEIIIERKERWGMIYFKK